MFFPQACLNYSMRRVLAEWGKEIARAINPSPSPGRIAPGGHDPLRLA